MTPGQRATLEKKYYQITHNRPDGVPTWGEFLETVQPTFGCNDAVTVKWCNMWRLAPL